MAAHEVWFTEQLGKLDGAPIEEMVTRLEQCASDMDGLSAAQEDSVLLYSASLHDYLYLNPARTNRAGYIDEAGAARIAGLLGREARRQGVSINFTKSLTDDATATICQPRPAPMFVAMGGDFRAKRRAADQEDFVMGVYNDQNAYVKDNRLVLFGCMQGTGWIGVERDYTAKRIELQNWPTSTVYYYTDPGQTGVIVELYRAYSVDAWRLAAKYPKQKDDILDHADDTGCIIVYDGWRMPSYPGAKDGRWLRCAKKDVPLVWEEYNWYCPPAVWWSWNEDLTGCSGVSIPQEIRALQEDINMIETTIRSGIYMGGNLKIFIDKQSAVSRSQLSNSLMATVVEWDSAQGQKPEYIVNDIVSNQLVQHQQWLAELMRFNIGLSDQRVETKAQSGRAKLVDANQAQLRLMKTIRAHDTMMGKDLPLRILEAASDMKDKVGDLVVVNHETKVARQVKLSDIDLLRDGVKIDVLTTSGLGLSAGTLYAQIQQARNDGYYDLRQARRLNIHMPDTQTERDASMLSEEAIDFRLNKILEGAKSSMWGPIPQMDLERALERVTQEILTASTKDEPDEKVLKQLREWSAAVMREQKKAKEALKPPAAPVAPTNPLASALVPQGAIAPVAPAGLGPAPGGPPPEASVL